mmetsp:Transcript_133744/g.198864  ORF Transcript_133744/g.198864 Transcript_133744/m.198864 type:complete len:418 (+) Transcript_133744:54-1307(+)
MSLTALSSQLALPVHGRARGHAGARSGGNRRVGDVVSDGGVHDERQVKAELLGLVQQRREPRRVDLFLLAHDPQVAPVRHGHERVLVGLVDLDEEVGKRNGDPDPQHGCCQTPLGLEPVGHLTLLLHHADRVLPGLDRRELHADHAVFERVVLDVVARVLVEGRRDMRPHVPPPHEPLQLDRPLQRLQRVGHHLADPRWPALLARPLLQLLHHDPHFLLAVLGEAALGERRAGDVLAPRRPVEVERAGFQLVLPDHAQPDDALGPFPRVPHRFQEAFGRAESLVNPLGAHPPRVAADESHGGMQLAELLCQKHLAALGASVRQVAVVCPLPPAGDAPRRKLGVVHASARHEHDARAWCLFQRRDRKLAQEIASEQQVRRESDLDVLRGELLLIEKRAGIAHQPVQTDRFRTTCCLLV